MSAKSVVVIGGGLAGLSCGVALAEAGFRVSLFEKRPHLGGRATSYWLPNGEHVDNCQHVTMGCCTNLADFYRRVGASGKIHFYNRLFFLDRRGRRGVVEPSTFPAPFHLGPSFLLFPSLMWADKQAIGRAMLAIVQSGGNPPDAAGRSMFEWLRRQQQTPAALNYFWRVVLVSALNEELDRTDARFGVDVFWKAFLANRRGFEVGIPSVPLAELYDGCSLAIEQRGGEVRLRAGIRQLQVVEGTVTSAVLEDGSELKAEYFVLAVPHDAVAALLPPSVAEREPVFQNLGNLRTSPITGVHLWFDRAVMSDPFVTLLDRTTQWVFNKTRLSQPAGAADSSEAAPPAPAEVQYLQLVISASYDLVPLSRQEIIDLCLGELREALPATRDAQLLKATVVKEVDATFSPTPGSARWRPAQRSPIKNLFLAGDWTETGWPATMEGAVRSGYLAAEAVLAVEGRPRRLIVPDLPTEGLTRFLRREKD